MWLWCGLDTWGEQASHLGTRHDYSGVDSDYGDTDNTDTLPTAGNTRNSHHARGAYSPSQEDGGWGQVSSAERRDHLTS